MWAAPFISFTCQRLCDFEIQKIAKLQQTACSKPLFTNVSLDIFGLSPHAEQWGAIIFTCRSMRAVHIKITAIYLFVVQYNTLTQIVGEISGSCKELEEKKPDRTNLLLDIQSFSSLTYRQHLGKVRLRRF